MAKEIITSTSLFGKLDVINSSGAISLKDFEGDSMLVPNVQAIGIIQAPDRETGEMLQSAVIRTSDGAYFTTISQSIMESLDDIMDFVEDEPGKYTLKVTRRISKGNKREFLTATIQA